MSKNGNLKKVPEKNENFLKMKIKIYLLTVNALFLEFLGLCLNYMSIILFFKNNDIVKIRKNGFYSSNKIYK